LNATIYHNPRCSKSREALAMLVEAGADVTIVEYLKTPPSRAELMRLYARAGMTPRQGLRMAEDGAKAVKHGDADAILDAMMVDPLLIERPLVETDKGVRLGRPTERIREIL
jgi:arsenate reductase